MGAGIRDKLRSFARTVSRSAMAGLGKTYNGCRDMYEALGYTITLSFDDYYGKFKRQDIANRVVRAYPNATWREPPILIDNADTSPETDSPFIEEWKALVKRTKLYHYLNRADVLSGIGEYGVLFMGFNDGKPSKEPVSRASDVLFLQPYTQKNANIITWETDPNNERFGLPTEYRLTSTNGGVNLNKGMTVHWSRVIHIAEFLEENDICGMPRLEPVYNRLEDLEKIAGGSAEMFWRGAFPGFGLVADEDAMFDTDSEEQMNEEIDAYVNGMQRYMRLQGVQIAELTPQVADPKEHFNILVALVSAQTGIPSRILLGSERGELASTQDDGAWKARVHERRLNFAEVCILREFIDRCILVGVLPTADYSVLWPDLFAMDARTKAKIALDRVKVIGEYTRSPNSDRVLPLNRLLVDFLGYSESEAKDIQTQIDALPPLPDPEINQPVTSPLNDTTPAPAPAA